MNSLTKTLVPNKEWLIRNEFEKICSVSKYKKGYAIFKKGQMLPFKNLEEVNSKLGTDIHEETVKKNIQTEDAYSIYDFPCGSKPYQPVYNVKKKLPLFAKSDKSKSQYCAGYYIIKFRKGWVKSFCPKLITLERYPFHGPYKTYEEMKIALNINNKKL